MDCAPAGCSSRNAVKSNTRPSIATQHDAAVLCSSSSACVMERTAAPAAPAASVPSRGASSSRLPTGMAAPTVRPNTAHLRFPLSSVSRVPSGAPSLVFCKVPSLPSYGAV
jgi:hypothetical protein